MANKNPRRMVGGFGNKTGDDLLSHAGCTLPSAQLRFTSEFGMGSGGSTALMSPERGEGSRDAYAFALNLSRGGM